MSNSRKIAVQGLAALVVSCVCHAQDKEKKIKRSELPPPVEKTDAVQSAGATVRGFSRPDRKTRSTAMIKNESDSHAGGAQV